MAAPLQPVLDCAPKLDFGRSMALIIDHNQPIPYHGILPRLMAEPTLKTETRSESARRSNRSRLSIFLPLLPVLASFLGGATQKWAEGIVLAILGLFLLLQPPRFSLGWATNACFLIMFALALVTFLPAHWFFLPEWRVGLKEDFQISLSSTVSPQPWISLGALVSLIGGLAWLYTISTRQLDLRSVRSELRIFAAGIVFLGTISILLFYAHAAFPFWSNTRGFGPFPNKNQTADLFGISSILLLACGQDDWRRGRKRWLLWLVGLCILIWAILLNFSRAGIGILVGGSVLWMAAVIIRQRTSERIALAFSFVLLLAAAILLLGGDTLERFNLHRLPGAGMSSDFRWKIFHDTFDLIRASPWCGVGVGNFDAVFALFRTQSVGNTRALHPESDWLWLWSEMGWPAVTVTLIGAALLIRRVLPLQEGTNQRFRLAALIGALIFGAHGLIDVSGHRVGSAFAGLFLLGMSLHRPLNLRPSRLLPIAFRLVAIILLVSGGSWTVATKSKMPLPGVVGVSVVKELASADNRVRNFEEAISLTNRGLIWSPLDWQLYFSRAMAKAGERRWNDAVDDFRRARFLEPNGYELPFLEGEVLLPVRPVFAANAWREALRRAGEARADVYTSMLTGASLQSPEVGRILEEIGLGEPDLALAYLRKVSGKDFDEAVAKLLTKDPHLDRFTEPQRLALFALWSEHGDLEPLAQLLETHPQWLTYGWFGIAKYLASKGDFRAAYNLTQRFGEAVALPRQSNDMPLEQLQQRYVTNPDNYGIGYALYKEQLRRGRLDDALVTVRHFTDRSNAPAYFHFLEAQSWAAKQDWERAWNAWLAYREATMRK